MLDITVSSVNIYKSNQSMDTITSILLRNGGTFRPSPDIKNNVYAAQQWKKNFPSKLHNNSELPVSK